MKKSSYLDLARKPVLDFYPDGSKSTVLGITPQVEFFRSLRFKEVLEIALKPK